MKKIIYLLLLPFQLLANTCCESEYGIGVAAEWLYFMPSFDQNALYWTGQDLDAGMEVNAREGERQKYYSAFRVEASYLFCNKINELLLRYTKFHSSYLGTSDVAGKPILGLGTEIQSGFDILTTNATFEREYNYYSITGLYALYRSSICDFFPTISAGMHFISLHVKEKCNYLITNGTINQFVVPDMTAWALGPSVEFDGLYQLTNCFGIKSRFLFALLADQTHSKFLITANEAADAGSALQIENSPRFWHVVPSMEARLGLELNRTICGVGVEIEGGYELIDAWDLLGRINQTSDFGGFSAIEWSDFTLTGPFVRVNLTY